MKLTAEQIGYVSNYIQSFDIKWYELQVELTDHFVSIMEEFGTKTPNLLSIKLNIKRKNVLAGTILRKLKKKEK